MILELINTIRLINTFSSQQKCVEIETFNDPVGKWNMLSCTERRGFVCQTHKGKLRQMSICGPVSHSVDFNHVLLRKMAFCINIHYLSGNLQQRQFEITVTLIEFFTR